MKRSIQREASLVVAEAQRALDQAFSAVEEEMRKGSHHAGSDAFLLSASDRLRDVAEMAQALRVRIVAEVEGRTKR